MSKYTKEITVTDTQIEVIRRGLILDLEYCLNETDNNDEAYGPCGGYRIEIDSYLMVLKVLGLPEHEKYSKLWEQRKKEYNIAITE